MNRYAVIVVLGLGTCLVGSAIGQAEDKGAPPAAAAMQKGAPLSKEVIEREKAIVKWREKLKGSKWNIEVTVSGNAPVVVVEPDVLSFNRKTMSSETLGKSGYPSATYSLYPPTETSVEWEAMHSHEDKGVAETSIWRGEFRDKTVQGTLSRSRKKGDKETMDSFPFKGTLVEAAPPAPVAPPVPAESAAPAADSAAPAVPVEAH